ncbi:MAG TPA: hypothetical protein VLG69_05100 [Candidatus Andersenbacteria bacterium]|nr:hypothetical protein [Candidatus Andersenbacteria bacterium]
MTICIASICDGGKKCVIAADREMTAQALSLEFEHRESKIDVLSKKCVAMSSGDALLASEIISRTRSKIPNNQDPSIVSIAESLRDAYMAIHIERAEAVILRPRGFTLQEFKERGALQLSPQVYQEITNQLFNFGIGIVEFLVTGVDESGAHIFRIHYNGLVGGSWLEWCDKLGHREIGSGASHASILLALEGQFSGFTVSETIYNVYSAKKSAELAPGVGPSTDLATISEDGVLFADKDMMESLSNLWQDTQKTKVDVTEISELYQQSLASSVSPLDDI